MNRKQKNNWIDRSFAIRVAIAFSLLLSLAAPYWAHGRAEAAVIESVQFNTKSHEVRIKLSGNVPYKVTQVDQRECVIAFKNARMAAETNTGVPAGHVVRQVRVKPLAGQVVAFYLNTKSDVKRVTHDWDDQQRILRVILITGDTPYHKTRHNRFGHKKARPLVSAGQPEVDQTAAPEVKTKKPAADQVRSEQEAVTPVTQTTSAGDDRPATNAGQPVETPSQLPAKPLVSVIKQTDKRLTPKTLGTIEDLPAAMAKSDCKQRDFLDSALSFAHNKRWRNLFTMLSQPRPEGEAAPACPQEAQFLKAFSYFNWHADAGAGRLLKAAGYFQDAINTYPDSPYAPFGMAALGIIYTRLGNNPEAQGYFKIILNRYPDYSGTPEVLLELGRLYVKRKRLRLATANFRKIVNDYPDWAYIIDAKLALGNALFELNQFKESLKVISEVIETDPRKVFETDAALVNIGNIYYQIGQYAKARQALSQAYNYFPDMKDNHLVLTRLGDILHNEKKTAKAINMYRLVSEKFPGTDGFVISSMRLAQYLKNRAEKENLYNTVIADYKEHPMANLARLRLATLQDKFGEFENSIETVRELLKAGAGNLREDAVFVMQTAYTSLFKKLLKRNAYPDVLQRFENDKQYFKSFDNAEVFLLVGRAYMKGHLHAPAATMFKKSYYLTRKNRSTPAYFYSLGTALHEAGQSQEALKILGQYTEAFPATAQSADAHLRMGQISIDNKKFKAAIRHLRAAAKGVKGEKNKALIMISQAKAHMGINQLNAAGKTLIKAINLLAAAPNRYFKDISDAYRLLGDIYSRQRKYAKATDALNMAIKFAGKNVKPDDLRFALGEAYRKDKKFKDAKKIFEDIMIAGDSFWSKLAQEKIREIELEVKLKK